MRVLTYNLGGGRARAGLPDLSLLGRLFEGTRADFVALQELSLSKPELRRFEDYFLRSGFETVVRGATLTREQGDYGNLVLCRSGMKEWHRLALTSPGREPRGVIFSLVEKEGVQWTILSTHLGLSSRERIAQLEQIRKWRDGIEDGLADVADMARCSLLAGDLNVWNRFSRESRNLSAHFGEGVTAATFPTRLPLLALDQVRSKGATGSGRERWTVIKSPELRRHSDHFPLLYSRSES